MLTVKLGDGFIRTLSNSLANVLKFNLLQNESLKTF